MTSGTTTAAAPVARRGLMLVLSSPSGAGKTTLCREILKRDDGLRVSISVTTRQPRPGEAEGIDYHFRSVAEFEALRDAGGLLEWAHVHGNLYGTPRGDVMDRLAGGGDVLFDIDWQGARQLAREAAKDTVRVFILPPSAAALEQRLLGRGQDDPEVIRRRLAGATTEIAHWEEYDYVIVNDRVPESLARLEAILIAERVRRARQEGLAAHVARLTADLAARMA
ncbi:MAG: guanylate kinase [Hyphomicrobiaceae bacterium]|nr:guanylate kinase [Hyphomicrobiaceae bacterium]